jgi:NTP pyrophosphatase (non-canonical NTP hydrolase)
MEKFISPAKPLTEYEKEALTILMEECAEVSQRAAKLIRFGNDTQSGQELDNVKRLSSEIGQLHRVIDLVDRAGFIDDDIIYEHYHKKTAALEKYMQHEED